MIAGSNIQLTREEIEYALKLAIAKKREASGAKIDPFFPLRVQLHWLQSSPTEGQPDRMAATKVDGVMATWED